MNKMKKFGLWIGATMMTIPMVASAEEDIIHSKITTIGGLKERAEGIIGILIGVVGIIAAGMIVWGGFQYVQGDADKGRATITNGIIGVVIAVLAFTIVKIVANLITSN